MEYLTIFYNFLTVFPQIPAFSFAGFNIHSCKIFNIHPLRTQKMLYIFALMLHNKKVVIF